MHTLQRVLRAGLGLGLACLTTLSAQDAPSGVSLTPDTPLLEVIEGNRVELVAHATGTPPLTYTWFQKHYTEPVAEGDTFVLDPVRSYEEGTYYVQVSNAFGVAESEPVALRVAKRTAPTIRNWTNDFELAPGEPFALTVNWEGSTPVTIEWWKDGELLQNDGRARLEVAAATPSDGGIYEVRVANRLGTRTQSIRVSPIPLTSLQPPVFTHVSGDLVGELGLGEPEAYFNATGSLPMLFELMRDGTVLRSFEATFIYGDVITASFSWPEITLADFGTYTVRASNAAGSTVSTPFTLSRQPLRAPVLLTYGRPPVDSTRPEGSYFSFEVSPNGSQPMAYQWFKDGEPLPGATLPSLSISSLSESDAGVYVLRVTNAAGTAETPPARLTVGPYPPTPPAIGGGVLYDIAFTSGSSQAISVFPTGTQPMTFAWYHDGEEIPDAIYSNYYLTGQAADVVGNYSVKVTNVAGEITTLVARVIEKLPEAPRITFQPVAELSLEEGDNYGLSISAKSESDITYQWFKDGEALANANNSTLALLNVTTATAGSYYVEAANTTGTTRSETSTVTVQPVPPLAIVRHPASFHDEAGTYSPDHYLAVQLRSDKGVSFQWYRDDVAVDGQTQSSFQATIGATPAGTYRVEVTRNGNTLSSAEAIVTTGPRDPSLVFSYTSGSVIAWSQLSGYGTAQHHEPLLTVRTFDAPSQVVWRRDGVVVPEQTDLSFWTDLWDGSEGTYTVTVTTAAGEFTSRAMTINHFDYSSLPQIGRHPRSRSMSLGSYDARQVYLSVEAFGPAPMRVQWLKDGQPVPGGFGNSLEFDHFSADDAGEYVARITNIFGYVDSNPALLEPLPLTPPVITEQPVGGAVGNPTRTELALAVGVESAHEVAYQWYHDGEPIPDADWERHTIGGDTTNALGSYQVKVSSAGGEVWSDTVEVTRAPTIDAPTEIVPPNSHTVSPGQTVNLEVTLFNSPGTARYQWFHNGEAIPDATTYRLELDPVQASDVGDYTVEVSIGDFHYTSPAATVSLANGGSPLRGRHRIVGNGVWTGQPARIHTSLTPLADITDATYALLLPAGWSLAAQNATGTTTAPTVGETDLLEWSWAELPTGTLDFEFTLTPPSTTTGTEELAALLESTHEFLDFQALAMPDPIVLAPVPSRHSADTNADGLIDLSELLRVIEFYNTRYGTTRTGRYRVEPDAVDGYAPDPDLDVGAESTLRRFHLADTDWDGTLSLSELLRVIELYNTRSGTTRTGAYHPDATTDDGFAPGSTLP
ncbi:immunoglobulin domain-containing protein [Actomonas aquatica]|uniref:Immunoglobulin domain-containing protein n=1 Tax=Actomonas aquatica TaxID=2866162 RepID=A0ABZ1C3C1_9BACT|nr:immunoglobulin domain-containing protein [Opitutus sp. WL0086]WRQ86202.1 immunoglobulin domain-containing protein [Opitutus sp. WL0086]